MQKFLSFTKSPGEKDILERDWPKYVLGNPPKSNQTKIKTKIRNRKIIWVSNSIQGKFSIWIYPLPLLLCVIKREIKTNKKMKNNFHYSFTRFYVWGYFLKQYPLLEKFSHTYILSLLDILYSKIVKILKLDGEGLMENRPSNN